MNRLTERTSAGTANLRYEDCHFADGHKDTIAASAYRQTAIEKLAAYEDKGLAPEEIPDAVELAKMAMALEKLKEYEEAEEQGRLVVLPCKVGDTLYFTHWFDGFHTLTYSTPLSRKVRCISINNKVALHVKDGCIHASEIGKTAFLTREEAEAALTEEENKNE